MRRYALLAASGVLLALVGCLPPDVVPPRPVGAVREPPLPPVTVPVRDSGGVEDVRKVDPTPVIRVVRRTRNVFDFESQSDFRAWIASRCTVAADDEIASQGRRSMLVRMKPGKGYPGITLRTARNRFYNWSGYPRLELDVHNPSDTSFNLLIRVDDDRSVSYTTRMHTTLGISPGWNTCTVRLDNARTTDGKRLFNWSRVKAFFLFVQHPTRPIEFRLDNIRLAAEADVSRLVDNVHMFDFGEDGSPVWPGFVRVTPGSTWSEAAGYGFSSKGKLRAESGTMPDDLTCDFVKRAPSGHTSNTFSIRVPNGRYAVTIYGQNSSYYRYPARGWELRAEGKLVRRFNMSRSLFYSEKYFYRGINDNYSPDAKLWERHVEPRMPRHEFFADVTDGRLDIELRGFAVAAMIVCPADIQPRARYFADQVDATRRQRFYETFCRVQHGRFKGWPVPLSQEDKARGYVLFSHDYDVPITPTLAPSVDSLDPKLLAAACPGEYEPVCFCVRPIVDLTGCSVRATVLLGKSTTLPASAIEIRSVQQFLARKAKGVFGPVGKILQPFDAIDLPKDVTHGFWLTLHVPEDAPPGEYTGTVTFAARGRPKRGAGFQPANSCICSLERLHHIPLTITVYPFTVPEPDDVAFGLYYNGPFHNNQRFVFFDHGQRKAVDRATRKPTLGGTFKQSLDVDDDIEKLAWQTIERQIIDMKAHGLNTVQVQLSRLSLASDGSVVIDFAKPARFVDLCRKHGLCTVVPAMVETIEIANKQIRSGRKEFSPEFNTSYKKAVADLAAWFKKKHVPLLIWPVDEPREELINVWNRNFADTVRYLKLNREVPGIRTSITLLSDKQSGLSYVPMIEHMDVVQTTGNSKAIGIIEAARKQNKPFWLYNAGMSRASWGFLPWRMGAAGRWQWHYQWWAAPYPYNPFHTESEGLTFPAPDGPRATVEYEWLREGIDDYRYLKRLEQAIARAEASGRDTSAAKKLLDEIRSRLPEYMGQAFNLPVNQQPGKMARPTSGGQAPQAALEANKLLDKVSQNAMNRWRRQIARQIIDLERKGNHG